MENKNMKNTGSLITVLLILVILGCKCQSDLFDFGKKSSSESKETDVELTNSGGSNQNSKTENSPPNINTSELGEYRECSERGNLTFNVDPKATPVSIEVNNKSQIRLEIYELGPNGDKSKDGGVEPGATFSFNVTFRGEWYMITDTSGNCKLIFAPPNVVNVQ